MRTQIDPKVLNELLDYDAVTGILSWKTRPASYFKATASRSQEAQSKWWNGLHAGKRACMPDAHKGYLRVNLLYSSYPAHRIIWAMVHGRWPENCIDHIDGDKANNCITNLREATVAENSRNRSAHGRSKYRGVSWRTKQNCWVAAIRTDGKVTFLGCFKDDAEAAKAYDKAAIVQHGKFARLNFPDADYSARIMSAIEPAGVGVETLETYFERQIEWSRETFGPALRTGGVIDHIRKELREIEAAPHDLSEWVDVVILAMDGFWRHGGKASDLLPALLAKQRKNMARTWPDWRTMSENSAIEHDRSKDLAALKGDEQ